MSEYPYVVPVDVPPQLEDDIDRIGDTRHVSEIVKVPDVTRHALEKSAVTGVREYTAIYRANSPDVPARRGVGAPDTDWKMKIRPHTTNRIHSVCRELP